MDKMKEHTCIICPQGCRIKVKRGENGEIADICGNDCVRGRQYVISEEVNPVRSISSTVKLSTGGVLPVKTSSPVSKKKIFDVMDEIRQAVAATPIAKGQVIIKNVAGSGADIVAEIEIPAENKKTNIYECQKIAMTAR